MGQLRFWMAHQAVERLELQDQEVDRWPVSSKHIIMDHSTEWQQWDIIHNRWVIQDVQLIAANNQTKVKSLQMEGTMDKETWTDLAVHQMLLIIRNWDHQVRAKLVLDKTIQITRHNKTEWNITKVSKIRFLILKVIFSF